MSKNPLSSTKGTRHIEILTTNKYELFVLHPCNRRIQPALVHKKVKMLKEHGWCRGMPMLCKKLPGGKLEVLDGQHRLEAAKLLGIWVWYTIDNECTLEPKDFSPEQKPWVMMDYVDAYCSDGNKDYAELREFINTYGFPAAVSASLLAGGCGSGGSNINPRIKEGTFTVSDRDFATRVAEIVLRISRVLPAAKTANAISCLARFVWVTNKGFKAAQLMDKCERNPAMLHVCGTLDQYSEMFEEVYNHQSRTGRLPLKFLADEAGRAKSAAPSPYAKK